MPVRQILKAGIFLCGFAVVLPFAVLVWVEKKLTRAEILFGMFTQMLSLMPGFPGTYLRGAYYFCVLDECSWEVHVGFGSLFTHRGARVKRRVSTGAYCVIGHATLEPGVRLASRVSIPSGKRQHLDASGQLSDLTRFDQVTVGGGAWIGEGAIVLADIGSNAIVSAGAVVIQAMPPDCIIGGNPARVIKELNTRDGSVGA